MVTEIDEMARQREAEVASISDQEIYETIIKKILELDTEPIMKANILIEAVPDMGMIFGILKHQFNIGMMSEEEYKSITQYCIDGYQANEQDVHFNPLTYSED
ncbi:MAG: hypothetical protein INQ03_16770 [Candidatus Heimdallarchaeota archaeon]|nr:hypothetical protein [Candidatus Heimdallarchaeota archaeon]